MNQKVVLITGANRGIGKEAAKQCAKKGYTVILTARTLKKAQLATQELSLPEIDPQELEVTDEKSRASLVAHIQKKYGKLDILINNAGILIDYNRSSLTVTKEELEQTLATNTLAPLFLAQACIPLLLKADLPKIINVSSQYGQLSTMEGEYCPAYKIAKAGLNAVTRVLAHTPETKRIAVNSVCPGWVRTDMGGNDAELSVEEGADTIIWLATLPDNAFTGKFFTKRKEIAW